MAEQNSATKLKEARGARKTAKAELRTAREKLKRIEKALATLEAEKRSDQKQRQENEAALQHLDEQLQKKQKEIDDRLQKLDGEIKRKNEEKELAKKGVGSKEEYLYRKVADVAEAVRAVKAEAFIDPLRYLKTWIGELHGLLQAFGAAGVFYAYTLMAGLVHEWWLYSSNGLRVTDYTILLDFLLILPVMSGVISTIVIILLGCGILPIPKISEYVALGLCVPLVALPVLRRFVIGLGMVGLSLIGPIIVGYCKYNVEKTCGTCQVLRDIDPGSRTPVTVLTDPPLRKAGDLVLVGSNSTYMFFKSSNGTEGDSGVKAIPLTRIVCVGQDGCEAKAPEPAGYSDYIAEHLLPQFISEQMRCEEGTRLIISDFIRFVNDEPRSRCPVCPVDAPSAVGSGDCSARDALDDFYLKKIRPKVQKIVADFSEKSATRWTVFGFASPDGEERENACLSRDRARVVIDEMCRLQENGTLDPAIDCGRPDPGTELDDATAHPNPQSTVASKEERYADTQVLYFGERHPINGISNSRSAVIAACVPKANG